MCKLRIKAIQDYFVLHKCKLLFPESACKMIMWPLSWTDEHRISNIGAKENDL